MVLQELQALKVIKVHKDIKVQAVDKVLRA
jgi:hypothetical protein